MTISNGISCFVLKQPFAQKAALLDGNKRVDPPCISDDMELVRFNPLFAHLFPALSKSQSMSRIAIFPFEKHTVMCLMESSFPAIKAADNLRTSIVSKHTVGYMHGLMIDTLTNFPTEIIRTRAPRNEKMVIEELEENEDVYRTELHDCLVDYYEQILKMDGAGGIPRSSTFKHKFKRGFVAAAPSATPPPPTMKATPTAVKVRARPPTPPARTPTSPTPPTTERPRPPPRRKPPPRPSPPRQRRRWKAERRREGGVLSQETGARGTIKVICA
jgi:hypothetical protein